MHLISALFFVIAFFLALGVIGAMLFAHRERIVAALLLQGDAMGTRDRVLRPANDVEGWAMPPVPLPLAA